MVDQSNTRWSSPAPMPLPFLSKAKGSPGGRLFWYLLFAACVLWTTLFYFHRPSRTTIGTTAASYASISGAADASTNSSSSSNWEKNNSSTGGGGGGDKNSRDGVAAVAELSRPPPTVQPPAPDPCAGRYIYTHELPRRFNTDILDDCRSLSKSADKSQLFMSNEGLGPRVEVEPEGVFSGSGSWYQTDQFALDVIFYHRMKRYSCLTSSSSRASAIFVPFFAGLDASRYLAGHNTTVRDAMPLDLVRWLRSRPEWRAMGGRDHFLVAGRPAWDFRRFSDSDWGNKLLLLPETRNMSVLVLESSIWLGNYFSVPYPTYFHPSDDGEAVAWQNRVRKTKRPWLFSFAGAGRSDPLLPGAMRGRIIEQCRASRRCRHLDCSSNATVCSSPGSVMAAFQGTVFCLQPPGDSFTRRSTFDAMVAGCVPVFFHRGSSDEQYKWHLPRDHRSYSVLIPEEEVIREGKVSIEERLGRIPEAEVRAMREEVIRMIPRLVYANPKARAAATVKDAFEVAVEGVIERVARLRMEMEPRQPFSPDKRTKAWAPRE